MRPLQLPPCFRRLVGSALAEEVALLVEPLPSRLQAATRGGCFGPNVIAALRHLSEDAPDAPAPPSQE